MARIFLSYARSDRQRVSELAAALEATGHEVWWDRLLTGGTEYEREIEQQLATADVVMVAWSEAAVKSHWVRDEATAGRERNRLVPLSLDGTAPPLGFRQLHTIDIAAWKIDPVCCCAKVEEAVEATARCQAAPRSAS